MNLKKLIAVSAAMSVIFSASACSGVSDDDLGESQSVQSSQTSAPDEVGSSMSEDIIEEPTETQTGVSEDDYQPSESVSEDEKIENPDGISEPEDDDIDVPQMIALEYLELLNSKPIYISFSLHVSDSFGERDAVQTIAVDEDKALFTVEDSNSKTGTLIKDGKVYSLDFSAETYTPDGAYIEDVLSSDIFGYPSADYELVSSEKTETGTQETYTLFANGSECTSTWMFSDDGTLISVTDDFGENALHVYTFNEVRSNVDGVLFEVPEGFERETLVE